MKRVASWLAIGAPLLFGGASLSCSSAAGPTTAPSVCADGELVVAAASSNYKDGAICAVPSRGQDFRGVDLADPALAASHGRTFILGRSLDLVFELEPSCGTPISRASVNDLAPLPGSSSSSANPHDVAVAPDGTLFVTLFNVGKLAFLKDGRLDGALDLSAYDVDGNPNSEAVEIVDVAGRAKAFVTLEMLDNDQKTLPPRGESRMLRVDAATRAVEASIPLVGVNPFGSMYEHGPFLYLAVPRDFLQADEERAGIERFDTRTSTSVMLVRESDIGASVAQVAVVDGCGVAIVADDTTENATSLVSFDPATGAMVASLAAPLLRSDGYDIQGLAWRGDTLYVGDRRAIAGGYPIHVFDRAPGTCTLTPSERRITISQPPVALRAAPGHP